MQEIFAAKQIFTGDRWMEDHAIIVNDHTIQAIIPQSETGGNTKVKNFGEAMIVPPFIDVQVYGAAQKLFSVFPSAETLSLMYDHFSATGTVLFLPTIATNTRDVVSQGIAAVKEYWAMGGKGVPGLHLEGPWLNRKRRGAHIEEWIHPPTIEEVTGLLKEAGDTIKMITIAPEVCSREVVDLLRSHNIILSAGHSDASYEQASDSFRNGITTVTHLYNAMSPLHHRAPGLVGAALNDAAVRASIIPDGHHVDFAAIAVAKKIMGERLFAITDAVTETDSGPYRHYRAGDKYESAGILSGSALSMHQAFVNLVEKVGIEREEALRMCSLYPAQVLGCSESYGRIAPGYVGQFLVLDQQQAIVAAIL